MTTAATRELEKSLADQADLLLPCVHCGFCLPACPTYRRLGDENDSPRGRLHLMRAVVEGRLSADSEAFATHIDRCLGCRACEPVCPSGVEYGRLLELARASATGGEPRDGLTRALLAVVASGPARRGATMLARLLRASRFPNAIAVRSKGRDPGPLRLAAAMLAASAPAEAVRRYRRTGRTANGRPPQARPIDQRGSVALLAGCVQKGLFGRVGAASARTLLANGYRLVPAPGQKCCGALHAHAGALDAARRLAKVNVAAFEEAAPDWIATDAAGCGATIKNYPELFRGEPAWKERAEAISAKTRDVTELLAAAGPRRGATIPLSAAYDHPCHLLHAQGVRRAPLAVLEAVPELKVRVVADADECCGGAGIYGITQRQLGRRIGVDKVRAVEACDADLVVTANPGCAMQIGAHMRLQGYAGGVAHPVEVLDASYGLAGHYRA